MATFKQDAVRDIATEIPDCCGNCKWANKDEWLYCENPKNWEPDPSDYKYFGQPAEMCMSGEDCVDISWTFTCENHENEHGMRLKPCPFCGPTASAKPKMTEPKSAIIPERCWVECPTCGISLESIIVPTREEAAEAWNQRP